MGHFAVQHLTIAIITLAIATSFLQQASGECKLKKAADWNPERNEKMNAKSQIIYAKYQQKLAANPYKDDPARSAQYQEEEKRLWENEYNDAMGRLWAEYPLPPRLRKRIPQQMMPYVEKYEKLMAQNGTLPSENLQNTESKMHEPRDDENQRRQQEMENQRRQQEVDNQRRQQEVENQRRQQEMENQRRQQEMENQRRQQEMENQRRQQEMENRRRQEQMREQQERARMEMERQRQSFPQTNYNTNTQPQLTPMTNIRQNPNLTLPPYNPPSANYIQQPPTYQYQIPPLLNQQPLPMPFNQQHFPVHNHQQYPPAQYNQQPTNPYNINPRPVHSNPVITNTNVDNINQQTACPYQSYSGRGSKAGTKDTKNSNDLNQNSTSLHHPHNNQGSGNQVKQLSPNSALSKIIGEDGTYGVQSNYNIYVGDYLKCPLMKRSSSSSSDTNPNSTNNSGRNSNDNSTDKSADSSMDTPDIDSLMDSKDNLSNDPSSPNETNNTDFFSNSNIDSSDSLTNNPQQTICLKRYNQSQADADFCNRLASTLMLPAKFKLSGLGGPWRFLLFSATKYYYPKIKLYQWNATSQTFHDAIPLKDTLYQLDPSSEYCIEVGCLPFLNSTNFPLLTTGDFYLLITQSLEDWAFYSHATIFQANIGMQNGSTASCQFQIAPESPLNASIDGANSVLGYCNGSLTALFDANDKSLSVYFTKGSFKGSKNQECRALVKVLPGTGNPVGNGQEVGNGEFAVNCQSDVFAKLTNELMKHV